MCSADQIRPRAFTQHQADTLTRELELDLHGICHACLSFVSFALDSDDRAETARWVRRMTPDLWYDGLAEKALAAARQALARGVPNAAEALADLERRGGRSIVARSIVLRLARELSQHTRKELHLLDLARPRLEESPPGLN